MAEKLGPLVLPIQADAGQLAIEMKQAIALIQTDVQRIQAQVGKLPGTTSGPLNKVGQQFKGIGGFSQQAGFQVGDFFTQVAGGTSSLVAFTQQAPQLLGSLSLLNPAFTAVGAGLGAVVAIGGSIAVAFSRAGDDSKTFAERIDKLKDKSGEMTGAMSALTSVVDEYKDAIGETANVQDAATARILTATEKEFGARKKLLELAVFENRQQLQERKNLRGEVDGSLSPVAARAANQDAMEARIKRERGIPQEMPLDDGGRAELIDRMTKAAAEAADLSRARGKLDAEITLLQGKIDKADELLSMSFEDILTKRMTRTGSEDGGASGGTPGFGAPVGSPRPASEEIIPFDKPKKAGRVREGLTLSVREQIEALKAEQTAIGLSGVALNRYTRAVEAAKIESDLLTKAKKEGRIITPELRNEVSAVADEYQRVANNVDDSRRAMEEQAEATKKAATAQKELWGGISSAITQSIAQAESFEDALRKVAIRLADIALNALFGQGPGGAIANQALGVAANGILGLIAADGAVMSGGRVQAFAKGGVVGAPTMFPMRGGIGLMGEAGPEAIMPLRRGRDGRLGVASEGGGGGGGGGVYAPTFNVVSPNADPRQVAAIVEQRMKASFPSMAATTSARGIRS